MMQTRFENLLSLVCNWVLVLIPVLFVIGHVAASGTICNYATRDTFDFMRHNVSSYAWRSPGGWAIVSCMLGFSFLLGFISWHAMRRGTRFVAWFTTVVAAAGMFKMAEVAWYPEKPNAESFAMMQEEFASKTPELPNDAIEWSSRKITGEQVPQTLMLHEYLKCLRNHWLHDQGRSVAIGMIILTMVGARFLWEDFAVNPRHWNVCQWMFLLWILMGVAVAWLQPCYFGLGQRVIYIGFYFWMRLIIQAIERERKSMEVAVAVA